MPLHLQQEGNTSVLLNKVFLCPQEKHTYIPFPGFSPAFNIQPLFD
jgi:hypothetical protein